jgi:hypothetical protein
MQPAGKHAWVCPNQKDQGNGVSRAQRESARTTAAERDEKAGF